MKTVWMERLGLRAPIVQAPMAGGATTPELVAAVSNAGGLGSLGAAYLSAAQIEAAIRTIRERTDRPFAVNLFSPQAEQPLEGDVEAMVRYLAGACLELAVEPPSLPVRLGDTFEQQMEAVLAARPPVVSFTFGLLPVTVMRRLKERGAYAIGTATTVHEAEQLEAAGVDAIVAQGAEAGAHRGTFAAPFENALIGGLALVPQVVDAVHVPVLASGGIMDGRGIAAALALGAAGVQMGTAFLVCRESGVPEAYKQAVLHGREDETTVTRVFSGRPARGLRNRFVEETEASGIAPLPYPWQNVLTREMRRAAAAQNDPDHLSLWAGQGVRLTRSRAAGELVRELMDELRQTLERLREMR